ncbi:hypothetical protein BpHYR1_048167 [Brachionus plicatilis]|uniref:Uncharacterized protein n=1 Tax=Brachionus plicatilis TaxID=10195 RepID=A0A3M7QG80_BRAPC|nr:hypothetical protein BpHYR1_048167 [Brachionus plicatilis]
MKYNLITKHLTVLTKKIILKIKGKLSIHFKILLCFIFLLQYSPLPIFIKITFLALLKSLLCKSVIAEDFASGFISNTTFIC